MSDTLNIFFSLQGMNRNLKQLELSGNQLLCTCELAWIWEWLQEYEYQNECTDIPCDDMYLQNLREVKCINFNNKPIIDVFKTDLDCFSSDISSTFKASLQAIIILVISCLYSKQFM